MIKSGFIWVVISLLAGLCGVVHAKEELLEIKGRPDITTKAILTYEPGQKPPFVALLLPGGKGDFKFKAADSGISMINEARLPNPLRNLLLQRGIPSLLVDAPSDRPEIDETFRGSPSHLEDLKAVLAASEKQFPGVPIIVVGHSAGTISAAPFSAAAADQIKGTILISGRLTWLNYSDAFVTKEGISNFDWDKIKKPLLLMHHKKDNCLLTPYSGSANLAEKVKRFELLAIDSDFNERPGYCTYKGTHNFEGQESVVADGIAAWGKALVAK